MGFFGKLLALAVAATSVVGAMCHGMLAEPKARNVVHNSNYCPHCLAAGGPGVTFAGGRVWPNSLHGVCGDPHTGPLDHEAGGKFATKVITGTYAQGQTITLKVQIQAPHGGRFRFGICPVPDGASDAAERAAVTQACFDKNALTNAADGSKWWWFGKKPAGEYTMQFKLPANIACKRCVLQWHYESGNSCTIPGTPPEHVMSPNMVPCDQTSVMEEFWNCADVSVGAGDGAPPPATPPVKSKMPKASKAPGKVKKKKETYTDYGSHRGIDVFAAVLALLGAFGAIVVFPGNNNLSMAIGAGVLVFLLTQGLVLPDWIRRRPGMVWAALSGLFHRRHAPCANFSR